MNRTAEVHELPHEARIATAREEHSPTADHHARLAFGGALLALASTAVAIVVSASLEGAATGTPPSDGLVWLVFAAAAAGIVGVALLASTAPRYCANCGEELPRDTEPWHELCAACREW